MRISTFGSLAVLAVRGSAAVLEERATPSNACESAIVATTKGLIYSNTVKKDCSTNAVSYATVYVTPTALTTTSTVTIEASAFSTTTEVTTGSTTSTSTTTSTVTDNDISTAYSTSTEIDVVTYATTTTPVVTITSVVTFTSSSTSTVTSYYATLSPIAKRDIERRTTSLASSHTVPAYVSTACTDFVEYTNACSFAHYTGTSTITSTLPAETITAVVSSTTTYSSVITSMTETDLSLTSFETTVTSTTQSSTITISVVATSSETVFPTYTASTSTAYDYVTVTVPGPTSTQSVTAPIPNFKLAMVPVAGGTTLYMTVAVGDALAYKSTTDVSLATVFNVDTAGRLITTAANPEIACAYSSISNYYMEGLRHTYLDAHTQYFTPLTCTVSSALTLGCTYKTANAFTYYASQSSFFYSTANYNNYPTYIAHLIPQ